jgi:hypothetical protein
MGLDHLQGLTAVFGNGDIMALPLQVAGQQVTIDLVIINDQEIATSRYLEGGIGLHRTDGFHGILDYGESL